MIKINNIVPKIQKQARSFVSGMGNGEALAPVILLEIAVTSGRTNQARKRGGFIEARERLTEEILGAFFWLGGVHYFNKLGDIVGKRALGLKKLEFNVERDNVGNPFSNYVRKIVLASKIKANEILKKNPDAVTKTINPEQLEKTLAKFKFIKIASSIILSNAIIGFIVPKMNQAITRHYQKSINNLNAKHPELMKLGVGIDDFRNNPNIDKKNVSFKGFGSIQNLLSLTHKFEHDAKYKLLSTDVGTAGGRAISARNKHERTEVLFRDLSSLYFYLFCRKHLNALFNKVEDGRFNRLDAVSSHQLHEHLSKNFEKFDGKDFLKFAFGDENAKIPEKFNFEAVKKGETQTITLEEFKALEKDANLVKLAEGMSKLQPPIKGVPILTKAQVLDVYKGGIINEPEFLRSVYKQFTNGKSEDIFGFVPQKDLEKLKLNMIDYVKDIAKKAATNKEEITLKLLKKVNTQNYTKNVLNLGMGFAVSAYFLSTVIPKVQYWITKMQTGQDKFPGVEQYAGEKKGKK